MPDPIPDPQPVNLIPPPPELRHRLAVALREVDILRRLIRVAEYAARFRNSSHLTVPTTAKQEGGACG
jgi:hypothetical protein